MIAFDIKIVHVEPTGAPYKTDKPYATSWYVPIRYTLEDGRTIDSQCGFFSRKSDAIAGTQKRDVTNMTANFGDDGKFIGTTTRYGR